MNQSELLRQRAIWTRRLHHFPNIKNRVQLHTGPTSSIYTIRSQNSQKETNSRTCFFSAATIHISPFNFPTRKKYGLPLVSRILGWKGTARPVDFDTQTSRSQTCSSYKTNFEQKRMRGFGGRWTYPVGKDDNETVFPDHYALLDREAKDPTEG